MLGAMAWGATGIGATALLGACSGGGGEATSASSASGVARRGGTARVVTLGSAADTTFNPFSVSGLTDYTAGFALRDNLVLIVGDKTEYGLASSIEPDATAKNWTIKLRSGVTWHDGSPLTSEDVAWTLTQFADPKVSPSYSQFFAVIDAKNIKQIDALTLQVPLHVARGDFVDGVLSQYSPVLKAQTTDFTKALGTGPFKLESYQGGRNARLIRNENYWGGEVYLDAIEVTSVSDATARLNAVKGDQADYACGISPTGARTLGTGGAVEARPGGAAASSAMCFAFNVSQKPFDDPRVVQAVKLAVDRKALVDTVLAGYGQIGADVIGMGMPGYDSSLTPPARDVARAKELFAQAGVSSFTMRAADFAPGIVAATELLAEQLATVGVQVSVEKAPADSYFADFAKVISTPAQGFYFVNRPPVIHMSSYTGSQGAFNVTGFKPADYDKALIAAQALVDDTARTAAINALQKQLHDEDGLVVWGYQENLDAVRSTLKGVTLSQTVPQFASAYYTA